MNVERIKQIKKVAWNSYLLSDEEAEQADQFLSLLPDTSEWVGTPKAELVALRVAYFTEEEFEVFGLFLQSFRQAQDSMKSYIEQCKQEAQQAQPFSFGIRKTQTVEVYAR